MRARLAREVLCFFGGMSVFHILRLAGGRGCIASAVAMIVASSNGAGQVKNDTGICITCVGCLVDTLRSCQLEGEAHGGV